MKNKPIINFCLGIIFLALYILRAYYGQPGVFYYGSMVAILAGAGYFIYKFIIDITE